MQNPAGITASRILRFSYMSIAKWTQLNLIELSCEFLFSICLLLCLCRLLLLSCLLLDRILSGSLWLDRSTCCQCIWRSIWSHGINWCYLCVTYHSAWCKNVAYWNHYHSCDSCKIPKYNKLRYQVPAIFADTTKNYGSRTNGKIKKYWIIVNLSLKSL